MRLCWSDSAIELDARAEALTIVERGLTDADAAGPIIACDSRTTYALLVYEPEKLLSPASAHRWRAD